jgi:hypothetical protein
MNSLGTKKLKAWGIRIIFLLIVLSAVSCGKKNEPVDINGKDVISIVTDDISKQLSELPTIIEYKLSAVQTSENDFMEIAKKQVAHDVVLHANLTYRIKYLRWSLINKKEDQCDAMAYSVVRDGKLYGDGVIMSQTISPGINTIGYREKTENIFLLIITIILVPLLLISYFSKMKNMEMLQRYDLLGKISLYLKSKIQNSNSMYEKNRARIVRIECIKTPNFGMNDIIISSLRNDKSACIGYKLWIVVGTSSPRYYPLPSEVEIGFVYVDSEGKGMLAGGRIDLRADSYISTGELYFPTQPYTNPFIGKAWIVKAYYAFGEVWENKYADEQEEKAKRFIAKKVKKLKNNSLTD